MSFLDVARSARGRAPKTQPDEELLRTTVANILVLPVDELDTYRSAVMDSDSDDPWIDHDREALRRAELISEARKDVA